MNGRPRSSASLALNAVALRTDSEAPIRVGRVNYSSREQLNELRHTLQSTHVVRRDGEFIRIAAIDPELPIPGEIYTQTTSDVPALLQARVSEWLIEHFASTGRQLAMRRGSLIIVSRRPEDNLLQSIVDREAALPHSISFNATFELQVRMERPGTKTDIFVTIESRVRPQIDTPIDELISYGISVDSLYVRRSKDPIDDRLVDSGRLTGRVERIHGDDLILIDHEEGWSTIPMKSARLEPRMEVLAHVLAQLSPRLGTKLEILERLKATADQLSVGEIKLKRIRSMSKYLRKQTAVLLDGHAGSFGDLISTHRRFPRHEIVAKPALIFDAGGNRTNRWNQGGLDKYGPFDRYQFNPKQLRIAVVCQKDRQGRVEQFVEQLLQGIPNSQRYGVGFLRRFALERPYVQVFGAENASVKAYRKAAVAAVEHITDRDETWNLALVQTDEAMEVLHGAVNPYLAMKAFFLGHGVAVQHVHFETMSQPPQQRTYSMNNIGLACYAKLGGVPWLLPSDQTVAHELVIGLGSHHETRSRFGIGDRYVGITTVFSGDGRYLLESRTRAVPFSAYGTAMVEAVRTAIEKVRIDYAWSVGDPVRLVFHVFKPIRDIEAQAVQRLMGELAIPHAEYAFLHVADAHPFQLFDEKQTGEPASRGLWKGVKAAPRGLIVHLSRRKVLLCLKGARELKQSGDGHPSPLLMQLHRDSTFRDLTYLTRQAYWFACHSWRSFLPAPVPITILYSQLVAAGLRGLSTVPGWSDDAIVGRIGRTRWFL